MISHKHIDRIEAQVKKNLEYFASLKKAQLARRTANNPNWETPFIAKETCDIMRVSCCGFFAYSRYAIDLVANAAPDLLLLDANPKFAITPALSTSSFIEAWILLARIMGLDEAINIQLGL